MGKGAGTAYQHEDSLVRRAHEWMARMNGLIHAPKAVDVPYQQVVGPISQRHREEEGASFDFQSTIP